MINVLELRKMYLQGLCLQFWNVSWPGKRYDDQAALQGNRCQKSRVLRPNHRHGPQNLRDGKAE